jgi:hypothetical protein
MLADLKSLYSVQYSKNVLSPKSLVGLTIVLSLNILHSSSHNRWELLVHMYFKFLSVTCSPHSLYETMSRISVFTL